MKSILLKLLVVLALIVMMISTVNAQPPTLLWKDEAVQVNDIALSKDGRYVAVAALVLSPSSHTEVRFYSRSSGTPIWIWPTDGASSVAISADGDCVAAGNGTLGDSRGFVLFWKNARTLSVNPPPTWTSKELQGPIEHRCLAISDDGNHLVAGGTGPNVFYWNNTKSKSGDSVDYTWSYYVSGRVEAVDISSDGDHVVAGTAKWEGPCSVAYWKDAKTWTGNQQPLWMSEEPSWFAYDVAVSDDGECVAAATFGQTATVYYWAEATTLSGLPPDGPDCTWKSGDGVNFHSIDMSSDGDSVVAGGSDGVYFWAGARGRSDTQPWSWKYSTPSTVYDVAIDDAGDYVAADNADIVVTPYLYFFDKTGNLKWRYEEFDYEPYILSISSDGKTLAVGTGMPGSAYFFETMPSRPVGGSLVPVNKLQLVAPWVGIALTALAVAVFVVKRRGS